MNTHTWPWKHLERGYAPSPLMAKADIEKTYMRMHCKLCGGARPNHDRYQPFTHTKKCRNYRV